MEEPTYLCPICGEPLEQGEYYYDAESDCMRVERCPNGCGSEGMRVDIEED